MIDVQGLTPRRSSVFTLILIAAMVAVTFAADPPARAPVPDDTARSKAEGEIKELFKADYARRRPADMEALAEKLLQQGQETAGEGASRFVLYREAARLAAQAGEVDLAFRAVKAAARTYEVVPVELKTEALRTASRSVAAAAAQKSFAEAALAVQEEAVAADRYDVAADLASLAEACAGRAKAAALARQAAAAILEVKEIQKEFERTRPAAAKLKALPDDSEANLDVGRFLCLLKGDWERGLPMLHAGSDIRLKELALRELGAPRYATAQVELGDGWWDLAQTEKGLVKANLRRRAYHWYLQAQPQLTGLAQTRTEQRVKALLEEYPDLKALVRPGLIRTLEGHADGVNAVATLAQYALSGSNDGSVRLWDIEVGRELRKMPGHGAAVLGVAMSADGRLGASAGSDKSVRVWNLVSGQEVHRFKGYRNIHSRVAISPEGKRILSGGEGPVLDMWSLDTGKAFNFRVRSRPEWVNAVAFTPDGRFAFTAGFAPFGARLWELSTGKEVARLETFPIFPLCGAVSADGRRAVAGTGVGTIHLLDLPGLTEARRWQAHQGACMGVAISADGRYVVSGGSGRFEGGAWQRGRDTSVALWNADTGKLIQRFEGHTHNVQGVAITSDGRRAVSASLDKTLKVWGLPR